MKYVIISGPFQERCSNLRFIDKEKSKTSFWWKTLGSYCFTIHVHRNSRNWWDSYSIVAHRNLSNFNFYHFMTLHDDKRVPKLASPMGRFKALLYEVLYKHAASVHLNIDFIMHMHGKTFFRFSVLWILQNHPYTRLAVTICLRSH